MPLINSRTADCSFSRLGLGSPSCRQVGRRTCTSCSAEAQARYSIRADEGLWKILVSVLLHLLHSVLMLSQHFARPHVVPLPVTSTSLLYSFATCGPILADHSMPLCVVLCLA